MVWRKHEQQKKNCYAHISFVKNEYTPLWSSTCTSSAYWSYYCHLISLWYKNDGGLGTVLLSQAGRLHWSVRAGSQLNLGHRLPVAPCDFFNLSGHCYPAMLLLLPKEAAILQGQSGGGGFLCVGWVKQIIRAGFSPLFSGSGLRAQGRSFSAGTFFGNKSCCCWILQISEIEIISRKDKTNSGRTEEDFSLQQWMEAVSSSESHGHRGWKDELRQRLLHCFLGLYPLTVITGSLSQDPELKDLWSAPAWLFFMF